MSTIELGVADLSPLPGIAGDPAAWEAAYRRMHRGVFLRSEGTISPLGAPQLVGGHLLATSVEIVERFNRFYAGVAAAYYERPELRAEYLVNDLIAPLIELEHDQPIATPISRFDAVLAPGGDVQVIELNSVGICMFHLRGLLYLIRGLVRAGFEADARALDELVRVAVVEGFGRFASARLAAPRPRIVVGALNPSNWMRAGHVLFRAAFRRYGYEFVFGGPEHVEVTEDELRIRGVPVDLLWSDFLFYIAYQYSRYIETKFPTKLPDYGKAPAQAAALIADARFQALLRARKLALISPARSYLALPKSLLSWIHRDDRPVPAADRAFLAAHVARTYNARDRGDGLAGIETVLADRGDYLIKPCQYGGSHGVLLGRLTEAAEWRTRLEAIWDDPTWVVQEFREPMRTGTGEWVSLGLANYDGRFGGVFLRTSPSLLVSARDSAFIPAVPR